MSCNTKDIQLKSLSPNESCLETFDPKVVLRNFIRMVMYTFYTPIKSLVIEYLYYYKEITECDLATRLQIQSEELRSILQEMKQNKFVNKYYRHEQKIDYYSFDEHMFINVVKYRLINMRIDIENCQRQCVDAEPLFKCEQCSKKFSGNEILCLCQPVRNEYICSHCNGVIVEDTTNKEIKDNLEILMSEFNIQMSPLFDILKEIDIYVERQGCWSTDEGEERMDINITPILEKNDMLQIPKPMPSWFIEPKVNVDNSS